MAEQNVWDIIMKAAVDFTQTDSQIKQYVDQVNASKRNVVKLKMQLDTAETLKDRDAIHKQIKQEEDLQRQSQKAIKQILDSKNVDLSNYTTQAIRQREREAKAIDRTNQQQLKKEQKFAQDQLRIKKQLLEENKKLESVINSQDSSQADRTAAKKQLRTNKQDIAIADSNIKVYGSDQLKQENDLLNQRLATEKLITNEQANRQQRILEEKAASQQLLEQKRAEQQAYSTSVQALREQAQLAVKIANLESKKKLTPEEQQLLQMYKQRSAELDKQLATTRQIVNQNEQYRNALDNVEEKLKIQTAELMNQQNALQKNKTAFGDIGTKLKNLAQYFLVFQGISKIQQGFRETIDLVFELDKAFNDIQIVTQSTTEDIYNMQLEFNQLAKDMSSTTQEVAEGATEWFRQGYNLEETEDLLRSTMVLSKVGAIESAEATQLLTSSLNGFKMEAKDAMSIVDKVSAVDLVAATSSEELMEALSRTASSADLAGVSFDRLLGMIGTVSSVTRKSASTIGESFKTLFARMQNVKAGADTDDEGESLNDVEKVLNKMGIALRSSVGQWRDLEEVLDEVATKWDTFNSVEQAQIATAIAGRKKNRCLVPEYIVIYSATQYKYVA